MLHRQGVILQAGKQPQVRSGQRGEIQGAGRCSRAAANFSGTVPGGFDFRAQSTIDVVGAEVERVTGLGGRDAAARGVGRRSIQQIQLGQPLANEQGVAQVPGIETR